MARPRSFDSDVALQAIKGVFWENGYEATSMRDIEVATGLNKQSLYRLFGDKRGMYLRALADYGDRELGEIFRTLQNSGSAKERFSKLFIGIIGDAKNSPDRKGCFLCNAAVDQAQIDSETGKRVEAMVQSLNAAFTRTLMTSQKYERDRRMTELASAHMMAAYLGLQVLIKANQPDSILKDAEKAATSQLID
jgi:TetR/AcrR family transcriptional regulator, transcriptional repressor for nem operon